MAKRMFATLVLALTVGFSATHAKAQLRPIAVDGCAQLARVVYSEVSAAALYGPGRSGPWVIDGGQGDIAVCRTAAKTVSQAFTSALLTAGVDVGWSNGGGDPGDFCLSAFLSQCYPSRFPYSAAQAADDTFMQQSWAIVSRAVMQEMYNPISSNEVHFRDTELELRIGLSLRAVGSVEGRARLAR
jgi:class 3 adenylate cyclase